MSAHRGFTLIELIVVIAILGVLATLLLPAVGSSREAARRVQCSSNLKQIGLAVLNYEEVHGNLPAGSTSAGINIGGPYWSTWTVDILPFAEQAQLYSLWNPLRDFSDRTNRRLRETMVSTYLCPSDVKLDELVRPESGPGSLRNDQLWAPGSYRAMSGHSLGQQGDHYWDNPRFADNRHESSMPSKNRGPMHNIARDPYPHRELRPVRLDEITDGTTNSLLVGEYHTITFDSRRTLWAYAYTSYNQSSAFFESRTLLPDYLRCFVLGGGGVHTCKRGWGSLHAGNSIQFAYCDGSVHALSQEVNMNIFVAGGTIQGEEVASLP